MSSENNDVKTSEQQDLLNKARTALQEGEIYDAVSQFHRLFTEFKATPEATLAEQLLAGRNRRDGSQFGFAPTLLVVVVGIGFWWLVGLGVAALFSESAKVAFGEQWRYILAVMAIAGASAFGIRWLEQRFLSSPERRALAAFIVVPLILLPFTGLVWLDPTLQTFALELVLIAVACLIPAAAYYLFLATRRASILNEFIANLSRLGLLGKTAEESVVEHRARVDGYFQRFEAIYGPLRFEPGEREAAAEGRADFVNRLLSAIRNEFDSTELPTATVSLSDIFRPNLIIPLGFVTILSAMGWLLVFQPVPGPLPAVITSIFQKLTAPEGAPAVGGETRTQPSQQPGVPAPEGAPAVGGQETGTQPANASPAAIITLTPKLTPISFAFLGAYFFGIQMLFRRFVRRDLGPNAYFAFANRIVLAVIAVWVVLICYQTLLEPLTLEPFVSNARRLDALMRAPLGTDQNWPSTALLIAFVVGVFPRVLWQFIAASFVKIPGVVTVLPAVRPKQPLNDLDGLTVWHEARLEEEDVENIPNMASADIVDLILRTQFPAERLVTWIDQAILFTLLGAVEKDQVDPRRVGLHSLGLRTATQLVHAFDTGGGVRESLAAALKPYKGENPVFSIVNAARVEPNYGLVCAWRGLQRVQGDCFSGQTKHD